MSGHHGRSHSDHARVTGIKHVPRSKQERGTSAIEDEFIAEQKELHTQGAILNAAHLSRDPEADRHNDLRSLRKLGDPMDSKDVTEAKHCLESGLTNEIHYGGVKGWDISQK